MAHAPARRSAPVLKQGVADRAPARLVSACGSLSCCSSLHWPPGPTRACISRSPPERIYQYNDFTGRYSWDHFNAATLDLGWRARWEHFFVDAGAGGGAVWFAGDSPQATPDLTLALGWEF